MKNASVLWLLVWICLHWNKVCSVAVSDPNEEWKVSQFCRSSAVETGANHSASCIEDEYKLYISTDLIEMTVDSTQSVTLNLDHQLNSTKVDRIIIRLHCENAGDNDFNWNSTGSDCHVLNVTDGYLYWFDQNQADSKNITVLSLKPGKQQLVAHVWFQPVDGIQIDTSKAFITVNVGRSSVILTISAIIGWAYFFVWALSFYPQIWDNYRRKSVVGLNFDYIALNLTGYISYSLFNAALYFSRTVQHEYESSVPRSQIPVKFNDVVYAVHGVMATCLIIIQCIIYEKGTQTVSIFSKAFVALVWSGYVVLFFVVKFSSLVTLLTYLYIFSYVKLAVTMIKYIPQAWYNYQRQSTHGWCIGNIFLDLSGGLLSLVQMFMLAYNYDDWLTIFNNFTKFGLGLLTIVFDLVFVWQHYVLYRSSGESSPAKSKLDHNNNNHYDNGSTPDRQSKVMDSPRWSIS